LEKKYFANSTFCRFCVYFRGSVAQAEICKVTQRPRLVTVKGKIRDLYGFEMAGSTYLYPEETLFLIECVSLSVFLAF